MRCFSSFYLEQWEAENGMLIGGGVASRWEYFKVACLDADGSDPVERENVMI